MGRPSTNARVVSGLAHRTARVSDELTRLTAPFRRRRRRAGGRVRVTFGGQIQIPNRRWRAVDRFEVSSNRFDSVCPEDPVTLELRLIEPLVDS